MSFFTILALVFGGGTVLVFGDYYIEFQDAGASSSRSRTQPEMVSFLYECKGYPDGTPAIRAVGSMCNQVTDMQQKFVIYVNCNFLKVYRPNPQGHLIHLVDRGTMSHQTWNLGYVNHYKDHPNFAEPSQQDLAYIRTEIQEMGPGPVFPSYLGTALVHYFAQANLIALARNPVIANSLFLGFVNFLRRLTELYLHINQEPAATRVGFAAAMKGALLKMIDPCSILEDNLQPFASGYCSTYCTFLNVAALHFGITPAGCSPLQGGYCVGAVCTCVRAMDNPLQGCQTSPMQQCNNGMRIRLNM